MADGNGDSAPPLSSAPFSEFLSEVTLLISPSTDRDYWGLGAPLSCVSLWGILSKRAASAEPGFPFEVTFAEG